MALSPSIPTSFVPKQSGPVRRQSASNNILMLISLIILALTLLSAGGVFLYSKYLASAENSRAAQLIAEQKKVSTDEVEQFLRLKNRLVVSQTLMSQHVALTQFLDELEKITLANVRFSSLSLEVASDRSATLTMVGQARTFNALAAQSKVFSAEPYIKSAIFSNITPNASDGTVSFSLSATLDPRLVIQSTTPTAGAAASSITSTSTISNTVLPTVTTPTGTSTKQSP